MKARILVCLSISLSLNALTVAAFIPTRNKCTFDVSANGNSVRLYDSSPAQEGSVTTERRGFLKTIFGATAGAGLVANKIAIEGPTPYTPPASLLDGKLIVITGGNTGLGLESAKRLASGGATIVITSRRMEKGARAIKSIVDYAPESDGKVFCLPLDLCDLSSVKNFPSKLKELMGPKEIDVLLNNAGVMAIPEFEITKDGYEKTFQTNHLGHFALTAGLFPMLKDDARIVNVSSMAHLIVAKGLDLTNLNGEKEYKSWDAYGRSKMENILFTKELAYRLNNTPGLEKMAAVTLHPGAVRTDLARYLVGEENFVSMEDQTQVKPKLTSETLALLPLVYFTKAVDRGATSQVWLSSFQGESVSGKFFQNCKEVKLVDSANDMEKAKALWKLSEEMSGVKFNIGA